MKDFYIVITDKEELPRKIETFSNALTDAKKRLEILPQYTKLFILKAIGVVHDAGVVFEPIDKYDECQKIIED